MSFTNTEGDYDFIKAAMDDHYFSRMFYLDSILHGTTSKMPKIGDIIHLQASEEDKQEIKSYGK